MSLISDALKKAQAQRQGQSQSAAPATAHAAHPAPPRPPAVGDQPAPMPAPAPMPMSAPVAAPRQGSSPRMAIAIAIVAVLAIVFGGGAALVVWGVLGLSKDAPVAAAPSPEVVATPAAPAGETVSAVPPAPASAEPMPASEPALPELATEGATGLHPIVFEVNEPNSALVDEAPAAESPEPVVKAQVVRFPSAASPPVQKAVAAPPEVAPVPAVVAVAEPSVAEETTPAPTLPPPRPVVEPDVEIAAYVRSLEVRGVMTGGRKILVYDPAVQRSRAFSPGDVAVESWALRIVEITQRELEFTDERGASYIKRF